MDNFKNKITSTEEKIKNKLEKLYKQCQLVCNQHYTKVDRLEMQMPNKEISLFIIKMPEEKEKFEKTIMNIFSFQRIVYIIKTY